MSRSAAGSPPSPVAARLGRGPKRRPSGTGADCREQYAAPRASSPPARSDRAFAAGRSIGVRTELVADIRVAIRPVHGLARTHPGGLDMRVGRDGQPCG